MQSILERDKLLFDPPELGCVLYLPFRRLDGSAFMSRDAYGHVCTNYGSLWTPQGRSFDGVDDYINCGNAASLNVTNAITVETWVKADRIIANSGVLGKNVSYRLQSFVDGSLKYNFRLQDSDGIYYSNITVSDLSLGQCFYLVATYKQGDYVRLYLNGVLDSTSASVFSKSLYSYPFDVLKIGYAANCNYYPGLIELPRIYNRALSALEIQNHFNREKHLFGVM
jgi:hypothetical protein